MRNLPRPTHVERLAAEALTSYQWAAAIAATLYEADLLADIVSPDELAIAFGFDVTDISQVDDAISDATHTWNRAQQAVMLAARDVTRGTGGTQALADALEALDAAASTLQTLIDQRHPST